MTVLDVIPDVTVEHYGDSCASCRHPSSVWDVWGCHLRSTAAARAVAVATQWGSGYSVLQDGWRIVPSLEVGELLENGEDVWFDFVLEQSGDTLTVTDPITDKQEQFTRLRLWPGHAERLSRMELRELYGPVVERLASAGSAGEWAVDLLEEAHRRGPQCLRVTAEALSTVDAQGLPARPSARQRDVFLGLASDPVFVSSDRVWKAAGVL